MRLVLSVSLIVLSLQGCGGALLNDRLTTLDWERQQQVGTVAISDPKLFRREALINERRDEVAWINQLIKDSPKAEFKPEVLREVEVIRAFSLALGLKFDPAAGVNFTNQQATNELQQEIAVMRLQLQLDQLKRDAELARAAFAERTQLANSNLTALDEGNSVTSLPSGPTAEEASNKLVDTITNLQSRLDNESKAPLGVDAVSTNPIDEFRDRLAYRNILTNARNAATLDEIHDLGNSALIRLNFEATTIPPSNKRAVPAVIQMTAKPGSEASKAVYYLNWLNYLNQEAVKRDLRPDRKPGDPFHLDTLPFRGLFSTLIYKEANCQGGASCRSVKYAVPRVRGLNSYQLPSVDLAKWLRANANDKTRFYAGRLDCVEGSVSLDGNKCVKEEDYQLWQEAQQTARQDFDQSEDAEGGEGQPPMQDNGQTKVQDASRSEVQPPTPRSTEAVLDTATLDKRRTCSILADLLTNPSRCGLDVSMSSLARDNIDKFAAKLSSNSYAESYNPSVWLDLAPHVFENISAADRSVSLFDFIEMRKLIVQVEYVLNNIELINYDKRFDAKCEFDAEQNEEITNGHPNTAPACSELRKNFRETSARAHEFLELLKHVLETDRNSTNKGLIDRNLKAIAQTPEQIAVIPQRFDALISRQGTEVQIYEVGPREQVQQVGSNARAASSLGIALAIAASKPSSGIGANANTSFSQQATSKVQARERVPAVTGYAVGSTGTFGWVLGPTATVDRKGKLDLAQVLTPYDLSVDLSVPAWWGSVLLEAVNTWSPTQNDIARGLITYTSNKEQTTLGPQDFEVIIPRSANDMRQLTQQLIRGDFRDSTRSFSIDHGQDLKYSVAACRTTTIAMQGEQVWRTNAVLIDGFRIGEESISIAPDMTGVLVSVPALDKKVSSAASGSVVATLLSPYGNGTVSLRYEGAPLPDGCGKSPDPDAIRAIKIAEKKIEIREGTPSGSKTLNFVVSGANLDDVKEVKVRTQTGSLIEEKKKEKTLEFTLTWDQIRALPNGNSEVHFYDSEGKSKSKLELIIQYMDGGNN